MSVQQGEKFYEKAQGCIERGIKLGSKPEIVDGHEQPVQISGHFSYSGLPYLFDPVNRNKLLARLAERADTVLPHESYRWLGFYKSEDESGIYLEYDSERARNFLPLDQEAFSEMTEHEADEVVSMCYGGVVLLRATQDTGGVFNFGGL